MTLHDTGFALRHVVSCGAVLLIGIGAASSQGISLIATVDKPVTLPIISSPQAMMSANRAPSHVVVTVTGFTPSSSGPVQAVVDARCGDTQIEIGRFGIMPQTTFTSANPTKLQRFSLPLTAGSACSRPDSVTIRLVPSRGDGRGATIEIGSAVLR
jgi:hypothetical protein